MTMTPTGQMDAAEYEPGNVEDVGLDFLVTAARFVDNRWTKPSWVGACNMQRPSEFFVLKGKWRAANQKLSNRTFSFMYGKWGEKETLQELPKLPVTSYLENQV